MRRGNEDGFGAGLGKNPGKAMQRSKSFFNFFFILGRTNVRQEKGRVGGETGKDNHF